MSLYKKAINSLSFLSMRKLFEFGSKIIAYITKALTTSLLGYSAMSV